MHYYSIVEYVVHSYCNEVRCKMQLEKMSLVPVTTRRIAKKFPEHVAHSSAVS